MEIQETAHLIWHNAWNIRFCNIEELVNNFRRIGYASVVNWASQRLACNDVCETRNFLYPRAYMTVTLHCEDSEHTCSREIVNAAFGARMVTA